MKAFSRRLGWAIALAALSGAAPAFAGEGPTADSLSVGTARALDALWPGHPEAIDMLADILIKGEEMGGADGWFRKAPSRTRFDWGATRAALDRDGDGSVTRAEFGGPDADFARLDRDRDGRLSAADFDFSARPSGPPAGSILLVRADRDGDGRLTRDELDRFFRDNDREGLGFLSLADLQEALSTAPGPGASSSIPTRSVLLKSFFRGELGAWPPGPPLDAPAPDFTLKAAEGGEAVSLSKLVGPKPIVLVFGNFTCGPFRGQAGNLQKLHARYKDRAEFLMVYVREPHPTDGWRMENNDRVGVAVRQPRDASERLEVARSCGRTLKLGFPMLVDTMDDAVNNAYSGIPSRLYLIDRGGKIAFKNGRGPFGFRLAELEQSLLLLLRQEATAAGPPADGDRPPGGR